MPRNPNPQCEHCADMHDGFYGSWASPCPIHNEDGSLKNPPQPAVKPAITSFQGGYRFLSNFYPSTIIAYDGIRYPTVEHAYQAQKAINGRDRLFIARLPEPKHAKAAGRKMRCRKDWEQIKVGVMRDLLLCKFCDMGLQRMLLATEGRELIEGNTWGDRFWGVCGGEGQNMLGRLLMELRDGLLAQAAKNKTTP